MQDQEYNRFGEAGAVDQEAGLLAHMRQVYNTMAIGMVITFAAAWAIGTSPALLAYLTNPETKGMTLLGWVVLLAPLGMIFCMGAVMQASAQAVQTFFYAFSAVMGVSLSSIFAVYTGESIAATFLVTALSFAGLSVYGMMTKRNLSGMGSFLIMGLIGLIIASLVNIFLQSSAMSFAISAIGVLIFAGLIAYDTQKMRENYFSARHAGEESRSKIATMDALSLYMDFINLFLHLLKFMGNRK